VESIYHIPHFLKGIGVDRAIMDILAIDGKTGPSLFERWNELAEKIKKPTRTLKIGMAGKYTNVHDSYLSILKALEHTAPYIGAKVETVWVETTDIEEGRKTPEELMKDLDGIIVPGGFGKRGIEGMIACSKYARENRIPYLGLCLGFQIALIDVARNVCGLEEANSTEFEPDTKQPVIDILPEQKKLEGLGGNMRLGGKDVQIVEGTNAHRLYGKTLVRERFRHRFECNPEYIKMFEENGVVFSGMHPEFPIMQILEMPGHPFFMATQFHAEFTSRPLDPSPIFSGFLEAAIKRGEK